MLGDDRASMNEATINGLRQGKDAVKANGGAACHMPITRAVLTACTNAHRTYEEYKAAEQQKMKEKQSQARAEEEERVAKEKAKEQMKQKLKELKVTEKDVDDEEKAAKEELCKATQLLNETQQRLNKAVAAKDMQTQTY